MRLSIFAAATAATLLCASAASAAVVGVTSQSALGANDFIAWGQLGGDYTSLSGPLNVMSDGGLAVTVSSDDNTFERRNQGSGWAGNFAPGTELLWDQGAGGHITLTFASLIKGAGAYIQQDNYGAFTADILASNGAVLGTFSNAGLSHGNGDGSAIFIGILSDAADIAAIRFSLASGMDFAISGVSVNGAGGGGGAVPEPATWALMIGGFGLAGTALRRRKALAA